ncbi:MAG: DNA mismatch repair endonuclease MutL [Planctomycetota bacterium]
MGRIVQLSKSVVDRIAAGEVIERPASVVRELVENGLDAGAVRIDVRVEEGGKNLVAVTDDGEGILEEDLARAVMSHATSKLAEADDLFRIRTLGFRGEALPSIASVSLMKIASRARGAESGAVLEVKGGEAGDVIEVGRAEGTTVEVKKLFFNTPVRRRFLRKDATELGHVVDQVTLYALAHPSVHFTLTHDGREVVDAPPGKDLRERLAAFHPAKLVSALVPVFHEEAGLTLKGFIAPPTEVRPNARSIHLFLNGRAIRDRTLLHAVTESYRDRIPSGRYPVVFLFLALDPREVDVNVHPAKIEVRFHNGGKLHSLVMALLREALEQQGAPPPTLTLAPEPAPASRVQRSFPLHGEPSGEPPRERVREALEAYMQDRAAGPMAPAPPLSPSARDADRRGASFLQVHGSYIVRETAEGIEIIDQHALFERVLYDEIRPRIEREGLNAQRLLVPITLDLDRARASRLEGNLDLFRRFGLEIDRFGPSTFAVHATPPFLPDAEAAPFIEDVLEDLGSNPSSGTGPRIDAVAKRLACRGAVKAGTVLNEVEIRRLIERASGLPAAPTCPHGRPAVVRIPLAELERSFHRR